MKQIKDYFRKWETSRIVRLVLSALLLIIYYFNREPFFLFIGIMLLLQAAFNISCPGGSCSTGIDKNTKPIVEVKKYEPEKQ
jgi:hypothetical protein